MIPFSVYAFIPLGVFIATVTIAAAIALWTTTTPQAPRHANPARDARIVHLPVQVSRQTVNCAAAPRSTQRVVYLRTPLTG